MKYMRLCFGRLSAFNALIRNGNIALRRRVHIEYAIASLRSGTKKAI